MKEGERRMKVGRRKRRERSREYKEGTLARPLFM
jgi:hypothetical protein